MLNHEGVWGSSNGIYKVDKEKKELILQYRPPWFDKDLHEMNRTAFGKIGYKVLDGKYEK